MRDGGNYPRVPMGNLLGECGAFGFLAHNLVQ